MRNLSSVLIVLALLLAAVQAAAQGTRYVNDEFTVPLRESPCPNCKIARILSSGMKLNLIESQDNWAHVTTENGTEGWLPEQYLVEQPIAKIRLEQVTAKLDSLQKRNQELEAILAELRQQSKALRGQLDTSEGSKEDLARELAHITEISSDALALNQQNQELVKQNHMLQRDNDVLQANLDDVQKDRRNESFLYGGITVFLGAILVVLIPKLRGKKRYSEWG